MTNVAVDLREVAAEAAEPVLRKFGAVNLGRLVLRFARRR